MKVKNVVRFIRNENKGIIAAQYIEPISNKLTTRSLGPNSINLSDDELNVIKKNLINCINISSEPYNENTISKIIEECGEFYLRFLNYDSEIIRALNINYATNNIINYSGKRITKIVGTVFDSKIKYLKTILPEFDNVISYRFDCVTDLIFNRNLVSNKIIVINNHSECDIKYLIKKLNKFNIKIKYYIGNKYISNDIVSGYCGAFEVECDNKDTLLNVLKFITSDNIMNCLSTIIVSTDFKCNYNNDEIFIVSSSHNTIENISNISNDITFVYVERIDVIPSIDNSRIIESISKVNRKKVIVALDYNGEEDNEETSVALMTNHNVFDVIKHDIVRFNIGNKNYERINRINLK